MQLQLFADAPDFNVHNTNVIADTVESPNDAQEQHADPAVPPEPPPGAIETIPVSPKYDALRPLFGWMKPEAIQKTFEMTTQLARLPFGTTLKRVFKSMSPYHNVPRRQFVRPPGTKSPKHFRRRKYFPSDGNVLAILQFNLSDSPVLNRQNVLSIRTATCSLSAPKPWWSFHTRSTKF